MSEQKTNTVHRVSLKKEPIWLKTNFVGKYEGIKFRFTFHEFTNEDATDVVQTFSFSWPGRIPDNKTLAEEGIRALFTKLRNSENSTITMKVIKDDAAISDLEEQEQLEAIIDKELEFLDKTYPDEIACRRHNIEEDETL